MHPIYALFRVGLLQRGWLETFDSWLDWIVGVVSWLKSGDGLLTGLNVSVAVVLLTTLVLIPVIRRGLSAVLTFLLGPILSLTIGRFFSPRDLIPAPKLEKFLGVGVDSIFVEWGEGAEIAGAWWLGDSFEVQLKLETDDKWQTVYRGSELDASANGLLSSHQYTVRIRRRIGSKYSEYSEWPGKVWTLSTRNSQGGSMGPLKKGEYVWGQNDDEIVITVDFTENVKRSDFSVDFKASGLTVRYKDDELIAASFLKQIILDDCTWQLENGKLIISISKKTKTQNWASVFAGHPPIDLF